MNRSLIFYVDLRDVIIRVVNRLLYLRRRSGKINWKGLCVSIMNYYDGDWWDVIWFRTVMDNINILVKQFIFGISILCLCIISCKLIWISNENAYRKRYRKLHRKNIENCIYIIWKGWYYEEEISKSNTIREKESID